MLEIIGKILSYLFVGGMIVFFIVIIYMVVYYTTYDFWSRLRWKWRAKKSEHIKAISIPISKINEKSLEHTTSELDRRVRIRIAGNTYMLKTITMSTDKAGNCYVTAWYREKRIGYVEESYSQSYNNPLSDWQL